MKHGKRPNRKQQQLLKVHGMNADNFLIVKDLPDRVEVVKRIDLKKIGKKTPRTISLLKEC